MSFDEVSRSWAAAQLRARRVIFSAVTAVYFEQEHNGCYGHTDGEYCYCDTSSWVDVAIYYETTESRTGRGWISVERHSLGDLIKELIEWPT